MRWGVIGIGLTVAALFGLTALPAVAAPPPHGVTIGETRLAEVELPKSNGFDLSIQILQHGRRGEPELTVTAIDKNGISGYLTSNGVRFGDDGSIHASVRGLGRIDLKFDPTSTKKEPAGKNCDGRETTTDSGFFRGTISLHGRRGFPSSYRSGAPGTIAQTYRQHCASYGPSLGFRPLAKTIHPSATHALNLTVAKAKGHSLLNFFANEERVGEVAEFGPEFGVFDAVRDHGVTFLALLAAHGGSKAFDVPDFKSLASAKVAPPAPFSGSAEFQLLEPKKASWTGDLAVSVPGLGHVSLAGAGYESELCFDKHCTDTGLAGSGGEFIGIS